MEAGAFFRLAEIRTKTASLLPFLAGTLYAVYRFQAFHGLHAFLMLVSLLSIDLATTILNNFMERATADSTFYHAGARYSKPGVKRLIAFLLLLGILAGGVLAARSGPVVWILGSLSFMAGILYSWGPLPLMRTPFGEAVSGIFMGLVIFFLSCFIHLEVDPILIYTSGSRLLVDISLYQVAPMLLPGLPFAAAIANVMLANNICDMEEDFEKGRYTLPVTTGRSNALVLFNLIYIAGFMAVILAAVLGYFPLTALLMLLPGAQVMVQARRFSMAPDKEMTFPLAVQNLNLIGVGLILVILSGILFKL